MRCASSRSSSPVSRLTRPISLRYSRTVSDVPLGDRHDEPQVGLDQLLLGLLAVAGSGLQSAAVGELELVELP